MKYDRIDLSEVQALKDEISQLKQEIATSQEKLAEKETAAETLSKWVSCLLQRQSCVFVDYHCRLKLWKLVCVFIKKPFRRTYMGWQRMGEVNKQVSALAEEKSKLETKVSSLEQEISVQKTT